MSAVVLLYALVSIALVWCLDVVCAGIVTTDSAWQALRATNGSRVHLVAEAVHQIPMLGNLFSVATIVVVALWFKGQRSGAQNKTSEHISEGRERPSENAQR